MIFCPNCGSVPAELEIVTSDLDIKQLVRCECRWLSGQFVSKTGGGVRGIFQWSFGLFGRRRLVLHKNRAHMVMLGEATIAVPSEDVDAAIQAVVVASIVES